MGKPMKKAPRRGKQNLGRLIAALITVAAVLLGLLLFSQIAEVSDQKGFWENFVASQQG